MQLQTPDFASNMLPAICPRHRRAAHGPSILHPLALAKQATQALIAEAELTPKPGLVDLRGSGAHHDLSLDLFLASAHVLEPYFCKMAEEAQCASALRPLREVLGRLGREAEGAMLSVTGGINTHRGAIWSLGLLVAGAAVGTCDSATDICLEAGRIARVPDRFQPIDLSQRRQSWRNKVAFGAREEACKGFPHIRLAALTALDAARQAGVTENAARIDALLAIMATLPDTCILQRGGTPALHAVQDGAACVLRLGGCTTMAGAEVLKSLEKTMLRLWISPGGAADLLAATLFVDRLTSARRATRD